MTYEQQSKAQNHFRERSKQYNQSSNWVVDQKLLEQIFVAAEIKGDEVVLDLATGTGLVAREFHGHVSEVIGLDISTDMTAQAEEYVDRMLIASIEAIPLPDASVDVCVCRQGLQFVNLTTALSEIHRVLKPGGRVVFCHLNAYGNLDQAEAFRVQALRNPARINFFLPGDLEIILQEQGFSVKKSLPYLSRESVNRWIDHGASTLAERKEIQEVYHSASNAFKKIHAIEFLADDILDTMLFIIVRAKKL